MGPQKLVQPHSAEAVRGSDMEDVVRFVNVDLIEFTLPSSVQGMQDKTDAGPLGGPQQFSYRRWSSPKSLTSRDRHCPKGGRVGPSILIMKID